MKVFKLFFQIVRSYWKTLLIYFLFELLFIVSIHQQMAAIQKPSQALNFSEVRLSVVDQDQTQLSKGLTDMYRANNQWVDMTLDEEAINDAIFNDDLDALVVIPQGFSQAFADQAKPQLTFYGGIEELDRMTVEAQANRFLSVLSNYRLALGGQLEGDNLTYALQEAQRISQTKAEGSMLPEKDLGDTDLMAYLYCLKGSDYVLYISCFFAVGTAICYLEEERLKQRTAVSGYSQLSMMGQIFLASLIYACLLWLVLMVVVLVGCGGFAMLSRPVVRWAILSNLVHMLAITSLVLLFSYIFLSPNAINFLQVIVPLATAFATGNFIPRDFVSPELLSFSRITPSYWDIKAISDVLEDLTFGDKQLASYQESIRVMLGMTLLFFLLTLAVRQLRMRKKKN